MPALRGIEPTSSTQDAPSNAVLQVRGRLDALEQRVRAVLELHDDALERLHRGLDLEQAEHDRLVGAEQLPGRDPVDERVADLAGRAGDRDVKGWLQPVRHGLETSRRSSVARSDRPEQQLAGLGQLGEPLGRARRAAPWSGWATRTSRRNRRLHVGALDGHAGAQAEHLHRPAPLRRDAAPRARARRPGAVARRPPSRCLGAVAGPRRGRGRQPGIALEQPPDLDPSGNCPGWRSAASIARNAIRARRRRSAAAAMTAPMTCGSGRPWRSSSRTTRPGSPTIR